MDDPADHTSVVDALLTPGVCRKVRCDLRKLLVGQPKLAHWLLPHPEEITGTPAKPNLWVRSLERAAAASDEWEFCFHLRNAFNELLRSFKPGRSIRLSESERHLAGYFALRIFKNYRGLPHQRLSPEVLERGLRALIGLVDILAIPEEERGSQRPRERSLTVTVNRLRHLLAAAQLAIDEEQVGADVELPPLSDRRQFAGPTATVLPFRLETREALERREARRAHDAAVLWKHATDCFWAAHNLDDPATPYATGLRSLSEGLAAGFALPMHDRITIGIAMLSAQWVLHRVFVPTFLSEPTFSIVRARTNPILDVLETEAAERAQWHPDWVAGLCADLERQANVIANAAHDRAYERAELMVHQLIAQQAG
ncbi:hypothetical protein [Methylorubrum extorquens]|uniref:Uncharacterized protein n=1 Tax=Methylorubrum extorquens TaxID=408 RepID=A0AAX3WN32_METEX|nr:hypothetical protein [Methylorubrum extorquens]WHQ72862.1 hypothetical protein KEC54_19925 [Methylorubrum extorquens]